MSTGFGRTATQDLTHVGLVLAPRQARGRWLVRCVCFAAALATGAGLGYAARRLSPPVVQQPSVSAADTVLREQLEQARLAQRLGDARSAELERQIDALNQRLRESQEELTFFRQARAGKH